MHTKQSKLILTAIALGTFLLTDVNSVVVASPGEHCDSKQMSSESIHERINSRLSNLAERLEIKSSQQATWEEYAKSVEALAQQSSKRPNDNADAATLSHYRADRADDFAKKLNVIADATAKLQKVLTEDQRKIFNQVSQHFFHSHHRWHENGHWQNREDYDWNQHTMER